MTRLPRLRLAARIGALALIAIGVTTLDYEKLLSVLSRKPPSTLDIRCSNTVPDWTRTIARWAQRHDLQGFQLYIRVGAEIHDCVAGEAIRTNGQRIPMTSSVTLPYASLTKLLTSTLVLLEVQRGSIDLEAPIYGLLHLETLDLSQEDRWQAISVRDLLQHRGGFDRAISGDPMFWSRPPCPYNLASLERVRVDFEPDTHYAYSNLGYCLLGLVLRTATGTPYTDLLDREISSPLGLSFSHIRGPEDFGSMDTGLYIPHLDEQQLFDSLDWPAREAVGAMAGTARNFGLFLENLMTASNPLGGAGKAMLTPNPICDEAQWRSCHGVAFYSYLKPRHVRMFWRDGSLPGATAFTAVTDRGDILVLLANSRSPRWMRAHDELGHLVYQHLALASVDPGIPR